MTIDHFFFTWDGANHPDGPWRHLGVLEFRGTEAMSTLYAFEIELVRHEDAPDVDVADLLGRSAALRIVTETSPGFRIIHGIVASAEEIGEMETGSRYRVTLAPPLLPSTMMRKSIIYLGKTIQQIIEEVLTRSVWGAGLLASSSEGNEDEADDGDLEVFAPPKATFAWRTIDLSRIVDAEARPYCVQYEESDFAFVSRILEEEGISYHFEHTRQECILVLSDFDGGRSVIRQALSPDVAGREVLRWRAGGRVRPRSMSLNDFNWRNPKLDLRAVSPAGLTDFHTMEHPGRYEASKATGEALARQGEDRLTTERAWAAAEARCRLLGAGSVFTLEHPNGKFSGKYLVTAVRHIAHERASFATRGSAQEPYRAEIECIRSGAPGADDDSHFRPARVTPRPRVQGSQTAIVTAEPSAPEAEINVGGPGNIGCARVHFHWDLDVGRLAKEPSSCWVRVSQLFAGANHGALWNPRVGHEVIVDFLDGDPDRPIITGRVHNGISPAPENATARPTYSAIKSLTSPFDGTYNALEFEDLAGSQEITLHASRDFTSSAARNSSRAVGVDDSTKIGGTQSVSVAGSQSTSAGSIAQSSDSTIALNAKTDLYGNAGVNMMLGAGALLLAGAPEVSINGGTEASLSSPTVTITGEGVLHAQGALVDIKGVTILIHGPTIKIQGGVVAVSGSTVNVTGDGEVNVKGGVINLNS